MSIRPIASALLFVPVALAPAQVTEAGPRAQEAQPAAPAADLERIDQAIRHARTGSAVIRPQAAQRLVRMGAPAARRLLELSGTKNSELALMGTSLIEVFGQFEDPGLRARLWPAMEDPDFPWRPAASRSLAWAPEPGEWDRLASYLADPIAPVRLAVLDGLFRLSQPEVREATGAELHDARRRAFLDHAVAALSDENDIVRRRAAVLLDARGHGRALDWIVEELRREDAYFDRPSGLMARYEAMNVLLDRGIDVGDFTPELPTTAPEGRPSNAAALRSIEEQVATRTELMDAKLPADLRGLVPDELPRVARAARPLEGVVLGLELRSCRRGDYYLRWTEDDRLHVGDGHAAWIPLPEGTTARLAALSKELQGELGERVFWGRPGCDAEVFRMPRASGPADLPKQFVVAKDEQPAPDLRPGALTEFGRALAGSIPTDDDLMGADPRTRDLAARVRECFRSIGGPVGAPRSSVPGSGN